MDPAGRGLYWDCRGPGPLVGLLVRPELAMPVPGVSGFWRVVVLEGADEMMCGLACGYNGGGRTAVFGTWSAIVEPQ